MSADPARRVRLDAGDRREQILLAAQRLFAEQPYESVSFGDIATAAGTTRTNLHYYFQTKHNLYLEVIRRFARPPGPARHSRGGTPEERVSRLLERWLDEVEHNRTTFMTMLHAAGNSHDPEVSAVLRNSMRGWEDRLLEVIDLDTGSPADRAAVRAFQAMISSAASSWLEEGTLTKQAVHVLLTRCLLALRPS